MKQTWLHSSLLGTRGSLTVVESVPPELQDSYYEVILRPLADPGSRNMAWQVRLGEKETLLAKWTALPSLPLGLLPGVSCRPLCGWQRVSPAVKEILARHAVVRPLDSSKEDTTGG